MNKKKLEPTIVKIRYHPNTVDLPGWVPFVQIIEKLGYIAIPRYEVKAVNALTLVHDVETNAPIDVILAVRGYILTNVRKDYPWIIDITV